MSLLFFEIQFGETGCHYNENLNFILVSHPNFIMIRLSSSLINWHVLHMYRRMQNFLDPPLILHYPVTCRLYWIRCLKLSNTDKRTTQTVRAHLLELCDLQPSLHMYIELLNSSYANKTYTGMYFILIIHMICNKNCLLLRLIFIKLTEPWKGSCNNKYISFVFIS